jgi:Domain of unknown function (DUF4389)
MAVEEANAAYTKGEHPVSYPVTFEADYVEQRNRLTAFIRLILAIPLMIWLYVYAIVAYIVIVIAWFAIVITGRYPQGLYNFTETYPPFQDDQTRTAGTAGPPIPESPSIP